MKVLLCLLFSTLLVLGQESVEFSFQNGEWKLVAGNMPMKGKSVRLLADGGTKMKNVYLPAEAPFVHGNGELILDSISDDEGPVKFTGANITVKEFQKEVADLKGRQPFVLGVCGDLLFALGPGDNPAFMMQADGKGKISFAAEVRRRMLLRGEMEGVTDYPLSFQATGETSLDQAIRAASLLQKMMGDKMISEAPMRLDAAKQFIPLEYELPGMSAYIAGKVETKIQVGLGFKGVVYDEGGKILKTDLEVSSHLREKVKAIQEGEPWLAVVGEPEHLFKYSQILLKQAEDAGIKYVLFFTTNDLAEGALTPPEGAYQFDKKDLAVKVNDPIKHMIGSVQDIPIGEGDRQPMFMQLRGKGMLLNSEESYDYDLGGRAKLSSRLELYTELAGGAGVEPSMVIVVDKGVPLHRVKAFIMLLDNNGIDDYLIIHNTSKRQKVYPMLDW
ncbi:hypothetical protein SAMN02745181_2808 [Rubritalea squalenifaciens DSM 18772]|uniref:Uncharacterized protein n=1 Tax=Rubritalea squalenifaciens DSM 18772 TaxID=1123071 RepID=A0A1M6NBW5_9BACT|nr:hypothetical protein [Rubritalea squalenifaciens]SHJ93230.1 hypothetical protein SAMN02745181_2808 [Rubritalea squalenifaciens DSM 18772]